MKLNSMFAALLAALAPTTHNATHKKQKARKARYVPAFVGPPPVAFFGQSRPQRGWRAEASRRRHNEIVRRQRRNRRMGNRG